MCFALCHLKILLALCNVCHKSNETDFIKNVFAKMFTFQRNPLQSSSLWKQCTTGGGPSTPGSIAGSVPL
jgi:hypothetical protein